MLRERVAEAEKLELFFTKQLDYLFDELDDIDDKIYIDGLKTSVTNASLNDVTTARSTLNSGQVATNFNNVSGIDATSYPDPFFLLD